MPHYPDGTQAQVGDRVSGTTYNQKEVIQGTIVQITPDTEACNAVVQFDDGKAYPDGKAGKDWDHTATGDLTLVSAAEAAPAGGPDAEEAALSQDEKEETEPEVVIWGHPPGQP